MRWLVIFALAVGSFFVEEMVRLEAQNHPWGVGIGGLVALVVGGLVVLFFPARTLIVAGAFLFGAWGIGLIAGLDDRDHQLGWYCRYGAQSQAELDACMERINTGEIDELDTPAARFSRGETIECGRGSGPYCEEAAREIAPE